MELFIPLAADEVEETLFFPLEDVSTISGARLSFFDLIGLAARLPPRPRPEERLVESAIGYEEGGGGCDVLVSSFEVVLVCVGRREGSASTASRDLLFLM